MRAVLCCLCPGQPRSCHSDPCPRQCPRQACHARGGSSVGAPALAGLVGLQRKSRPRSRGRALCRCLTAPLTGRPLDRRGKRVTKETPAAPRGQVQGTQGPSELGQQDPPRSWPQVPSQTSGQGCGPSPGTGRRPGARQPHPTRGALRRTEAWGGGPAHTAPADPVPEGGGEEAPAPLLDTLLKVGVVASGPGEGQVSPQRGLHLSLEMKATPALGRWAARAGTRGGSAVGGRGSARGHCRPSHSAEQPGVHPHPDTCTHVHRWCPVASGPGPLSLSCTRYRGPCSWPVGPPGRVWLAVALGQRQAREKPGAAACGPVVSREGPRPAPASH